MWLTLYNFANSHSSVLKIYYIMSAASMNTFWTLIFRMKVSKKGLVPGGSMLGGYVPVPNSHTLASGLCTFLGVMKSAIPYLAFLAIYGLNKVLHIQPGLEDIGELLLPLQKFSGFCIKIRNENTSKEFSVRIYIYVSIFVLYFWLKWFFKSNNVALH